MKTMSLYHMPSCPYCRKVRAVIDELGMTDQIELRDKIAGESEEARTYFDINFGPWDRLDELAPFLGSTPHPPGAGYYPVDMTAEEFEDWLTEHPEDEAARLSAAEVQMSLGKQADSTAQYREILALNENNLIALNNLAWYLLDSAPAEALGYAERANAVNPDSADVLDTLALAQLKNGDHRSAQRSIKLLSGTAAAAPR